MNLLYNVSLKSQPPTANEILVFQWIRVSFFISIICRKKNQLTWKENPSILSHHSPIAFIGAPVTVIERLFCNLDMDKLSLLSSQMGFETDSETCVNSTCSRLKNADIIPVVMPNGHKTRLLKPLLSSACERDCVICFIKREECWLILRRPLCPSGISPKMGENFPSPVLGEGRPERSERSGWGKFQQL